MAIGFRGISASPSTGTADPAAATSLPASTSTGDLVVMLVLVKADTITINTPSNWSAPTNSNINGGTGSGIDAGTVRIAVFTREYDGVWTMPTVDLSAAPNMSMVHAISYSKAATENWDPTLCASASDTTGSTTSFDPAASGTTIALASGDWLGAYAGINGDAGTPTVPGTLSATGITFGTIANRVNQTSTQGQDARQIAYDAPYSSGSASAGPDTSIAYSSANASMCGGVVYYRLRVIPFVNASAEEIPLTATAQDATTALGASAEGITVTATANDATVEFGGFPTSAPAEAAEASTAAGDAVGSVGASAEGVALSATANDATTILTAAAEAAAAAAGAGDPTVDLGASAQSVTVTAAANDATVEVKAFAECASANALADNPTVTTSGSSSAPAECATATATGLDPVAGLGALAEAATVAALAELASLDISATAEAAQALASAYTATVTGADEPGSIPVRTTSTLAVMLATATTPGVLHTSTDIAAEVT